MIVLSSDGLMGLTGWESSSWVRRMGVIGESISGVEGISIGLEICGLGGELEGELGVYRMVWVRRKLLTLERR